MDMFVSATAEQKAWQDALADCMPEACVHVGDDAPQCDYAVLWNPPAELFARQKRLKAVFALGAGVDQMRWPCRACQRMCRWCAWRAWAWQRRWRNMRCMWRCENFAILNTRLEPRASAHHATCRCANPAWRRMPSGGGKDTSAGSRDNDKWSGSQGSRILNSVEAVGEDQVVGELERADIGDAVVLARDRRRQIALIAGQWLALVVHRQGVVASIQQRA